jgi:quercetin dioxygenase-like cupin family protein
MDYKEIKKLISYSEDGIISKEINISNSGNKIKTTLFCMAKNTKISEHTSTKEGYVYVIEGNGTFNLEGKDIIMQAGVLINLNRNAKHSLKAEENTSFLLFLT